MGSLCIDLYRNFSCLAGDCPDTCCRGWKIVVDEAARKRFEAISDHALRRDILEHMQCRQQEWRFVNRPDGRCSMLDEDGLCRIQRNLDEKALCNTCRKYPRLSGDVEGKLWLSMAASCPVVAEYLWQGRLGWMWIGDDASGGEFEEKKHKDINGLVKVWKKLPVWQDILQKYSSQEEDEDRIFIIWRRFQLFLSMAEGCVGILADFPEHQYLSGSFDYFETLPDSVEEIFDAIISFDDFFQKRFSCFAKDYFSYRMFCWRLERGEISEEAIRQVVGELALIYVISFSRKHMLDHFSENEILENIRWVYRVCVHGVRLPEKILHFWGESFNMGELLMIFNACD